MDILPLNRVGLELAAITAWSLSLASGNPSKPYTEFSMLKLKREITGGETEAAIMIADKLEEAANLMGQLNLAAANFNNHANGATLRNAATEFRNIVAAIPNPNGIIKRAGNIDVLTVVIPGRPTVSTAQGVFVRAIEIATAAGTNIDLDIEHAVLMALSVADSLSLKLVLSLCTEKGSISQNPFD